MSALTLFYSLLTQAIETGKISTVRTWIQDCKRVNKCKGGSDSHQHFAVANGTALHWAVYYGQLEIAQLLLGKGAGIILLKHSKLVCGNPGYWDGRISVSFCWEFLHKFTVSSTYHTVSS